MPDSRTHRGAHPEDTRDFGPEAVPGLRHAAHELSFLFGSGYAPEAALKLVGDHHQHTARQRKAVLRASCSADAAARRARQRLSPAELRDRSLALDGFNCLISIEAMLSGAPILRCRDQVLRDLASVHGTYRSVAETERAVSLLLQTLAAREVRAAEIVLDRPVGNSGRTRALLEQRAAQLPFALSVRLSDRVDPELACSEEVVASSDSWILDRAAHWIDLPAIVAEAHGLPLWLVDLSEPRSA